MINTSPTCTKPEGEVGAMVWDAAPLSASSCGASGREGCGVSFGSFRGVSRSGTGAASSDAGREDTSAQADSSSGDSRRASMAGRASASIGNVSPSSQRSRANRCRRSWACPARPCVVRW